MGEAPEGEEEENEQRVTRRGTERVHPDAFVVEGEPQVGTADETER